MFPRIHAARAELLSGEGGQRFSWALETLITGVLQNAKPSGTAFPDEPNRLVEHYEQKALSCSI